MPAGKTVDDHSDRAIHGWGGGLVALPAPAPEALRRRAEVLVWQEKSPPGGPDALAQTLYELRVHQIELEMQNEELRQFQLELDASRERYFDFYDMAPVGYCTVNDKGTVIEANLRTAKLLGLPRDRLIKQPFTRFIEPADQDVFYLMQKQLIQTQAVQTCELRLRQNEDAPVWVSLMVRTEPTADQCPVMRIVLSEIAERKRMQAEVLAAKRNEEQLRRTASSYEVGLRVDATGGRSVVAEEADEQSPQDKLYARGILDSISSQIAVIDPDGVIVDVNQAWRQFSMESRLQAGQPASHTDVGTNYLDICSARGVADSCGASQAGEGIRCVLDGRLPTFSLEYACHSPLEPRWFMMTVTPLKAGKKGAVVAHNNITERKLTEDRLQRTEALFRESIDTLNVSFAVYDSDDRLVLCNKLYSSYRSPAGWTLQPGSNADGSDLYGRTFEEILRLGAGDGQYLIPAGEEDQWIAQRLLEHRQGNQNVVREMSKGLWIKVVDRRTPTGYVVGLRFNVTELCQARQTAEAAQQQLEKKHDELERIARYDSLTKLPNRALLSERLEQALNHTLRRGQHLAVVFIDLDGFKAVNDTHGHEAGDHLLITLAERMKGALRDGDILARLGGDEFVAVLLDLADVDASAPMLNRLLDAAARPFQYEQAQLQVSASLGVTFYPQSQGQELEPDQLMRQADQAMYQAKQAGKNRFHVFDVEQDRNVRARHESMQSIERALKEGELVLEYQPKVNLRTGAVIGVEALIRWLHPQRGLLPPSDFLPMIEDHPLAVKLGQWVIESALAQMERWREVGLNMAVSVNIGRRHLMQAGFADQMRDALAAHPGLQPNCLEIELLETSAIKDMNHVSQVIQECRNLGVECALDDFGSGHTSLTGLKKLPVKYLKIDQNFIRDMLDSSDSLLILIGVLKLASAFDLKVIAEGVETAQHGSMLLELGCELAQGYGIARPMSANELPGWVKRSKPDPTWSDVALLPN